jgi:hypothetical protein
MMDRQATIEGEGDWLDAALRASRPAPIVDDGFAARVMAALPPVAARALPAWRRPALAVLWALAAIGVALSLPGVTIDVARQGYRLFTAIPVSVPQLAAAMAAAAVVMWSIAGYTLRRELVPAR